MIKSDFKSKFKQLIKSVMPYQFSERNEYLPDFQKAYGVETSSIKNAWNFQKGLRRARKKLNLNELEWTYNNLDDEYSKDIMLMLLVYNLFPKTKIRLPTYYSQSLSKIDELKRLETDDEVISLWMDVVKLKKYNLSGIGYGIEAWLTDMGLLIEFINEQYRYKNQIAVEEGDYVIDGGACYGDTALYFAHKGARKIFSFEFIDENLNILNKNLELNPEIAAKIQLVEQPLSNRSGELLFAVSNGPGTSVTTERVEAAKEYETISIDDFVAMNNIKRLDFIKLDIEGSEIAALKGASNTIKKYKPKLAVCVYHKAEDMWTIPQLIKKILPEYKLYLDHHTINTTESVLYAKA